jgi:hypothetical protein
VSLNETAAAVTGEGTLNAGKPADILAELFSSRMRSTVLSFLLPRPHLAFSLTEMSRRLGLPISSLQHECYKLVRTGVLADTKTGNVRRYRPNTTFPLLEPLTALVLRALPVEEALAAALEDVPAIDACWIAGGGSLAADASYVVMVGSGSVEIIDEVFARIVRVLETDGARSAELAFFRVDEWQARLASGDAFAKHLLAEKRFAVTCTHDATAPSLGESNQHPD